MEVEFLTVDEVLALHATQLARYGGQAGVRDAGMLASAVAVPQASFDGALLHEDLFAMAAAYAFHIAENQPFIDGNKRTGLMAALVFLALHGIKVRITPSRSRRADPRPFDAAASEVRCRGARVRRRQPLVP